MATTSNREKVCKEDREYVGARSHMVLEAEVRSLNFILNTVDFNCNLVNNILERSCGQCVAIEWGWESESSNSPFSSGKR